jgi:hypothetical protein
MTRLILRLLGIRDFEVCQSCETLKQQLAFERDEKKQLTETLLAIIHPKVIEQPTVELNPVTQISGLFSRKRAALETKDRAEAQIINEAKHLGKPDFANQKNEQDNRDIHKLEQELGVEEKEA